MHRVLIVEDDPSLALAIQRLMISAGYLVKVAASMEQAYTLLSKSGYDLVILDRVLGDGDGLEIAGFLKDISFGTKVLFLTHKHEVQERIAGLEAGADDYLVKPIDSQELMLRAKVLLNRQKLKDQEYLKLGDLKLQPSSGRLTIADGERRLRKREAEILACLLRLQGSVVSKSTLIEYVWQSQDEIPTHTTLEVYIRRLRMALGSQHGMIKTVRGFGYSISL